METITFYISEEERKEIEKFSKENFLKMSAFCRFTILNHIRKMKGVQIN